MTAPVAPSAPAEVTQSGPFGVDDALASISQEAISQTLSEIGEPAGEQPDAPTGERLRGPDGKFIPREKPDGDVTAEPTDAVATPDAPTSESPEAVSLPDGFVAVPAVKDRELATSFKVMDAEGELDVPDLTIEFQANGKTRKEPLDKVVRLAERGVYNEEREQAVLAARQETQSIAQQNAQLRSELQRAQIEREALLASDDAYLNARAKYESENTPEARLQKFTQQQAQEQRAQTYSMAINQSNEYFQHNVLPAVTTIAEKLGTVSADEIGARLVLLTNHLRVPSLDGDSFIPPIAHQSVGQIILRDIVPWATSLHEERDASTKTQRDAAEREKQASAREQERLRIESQKAKNLTGRQTRPAGRANTSTNTREAPPPKPIKTVEDAEAAALSETLAAMAG